MPSTFFLTCVLAVDSRNRSCSDTNCWNKTCKITGADMEFCFGCGKEVSDDNVEPPKLLISVCPANDAAATFK
ncbi:hypothetical protein Tco_1320446 [Tanacetum coccineum]